MLPGTLAGQYDPERMQIDLVRLCSAAGARLIFEEVTGLDQLGKKLLFASRPPLPFDALSIGIGSKPSDVPGSDERVVRIKPMQTFLDRLNRSLEQIATTRVGSPWRIAIVGAGAGGFEVTCCLQRHLQQLYPQADFELTLIDAGEHILGGMPQRTRQLAGQTLDEQGTQVLLGQQVTHIDNSGTIECGDGTTHHADLVLWTTSATPPDLLANLDLAKDDRGFLSIRPTLQTLSADAIFAVGDTASLQPEPTPKAGVFAVRQAPVLWDNLQRFLDRRPLKNWSPQRSFLSLLNTSDGRAIFTYKGLSIHSAWCWKLKDFIDSRFMKKYQDYRPMMPDIATPTIQPTPMRCGGCGSKLPADVLSRVLQELKQPPSDRIAIGLDEPDDVAVIENIAGASTAVTTDFFTPFVDDPYLMGQVASENALSDLYATGANPTAALASVTVPYGPEHKQEQYLRELLQGALKPLRKPGIPIVGGHTIEGSQASFGLTMLGDIAHHQWTTKRGLQVDDRLVLTKPLGTGILLAGHSQALCRGEWWDTLYGSMLESNAEAAKVVHDLKIRAVTDVTGFGLARHLWEMLQASAATCKLSLDSLPVLPGAIELAGQGILSTLAPSNRRLDSEIVAAAEIKQRDRYQLLFDPQTSGGLLMGVPESKLSDLLTRLPDSATVIGRVTALQPESPRLEVTP